MNQKRSLLLFLAAVTILAAVWIALFLAVPKQQSLDERAHSVAAQLKCPVCQGESVADSPSGLALQMRQVIRQQLQAGRSEQQVIQFFQERYGDSIVWSPPWQGFSLLAWLVPIILLPGGCAFLFFVLREWRTPRSGARIVNETDDVLVDRNLEQYRAQLEQELAADDVLFRGKRMEAQ